MRDDGPAAVAPPARGEPERIRLEQEHGLPGGSRFARLEGPLLFRGRRVGRDRSRHRRRWVLGGHRHRRFHGDRRGHRALCGRRGSAEDRCAGPCPGRCPSPDGAFLSGRRDVRSHVQVPPGPPDRLHLPGGRAHGRRRRRRGARDWILAVPDFRRFLRRDSRPDGERLPRGPHRHQARPASGLPRHPAPGSPGVDERAVPLDGRPGDSGPAVAVGSCRFVLRRLRRAHAYGHGVFPRGCCVVLHPLDIKRLQHVRDGGHSGQCLERGAGSTADCDEAVRRLPVAPHGQRGLLPTLHA